MLGRQNYGQDWSVYDPGVCKPLSSFLFQASHSLQVSWQRPEFGLQTEVSSFQIFRPNDSINQDCFDCK